MSAEHVCHDARFCDDARAGRGAGCVGADRAGDVATVGSMSGAANAGRTLTLGVLVSGGGTNLQAIMDAIDAGELDARVALVVSSNPTAFGLERAKRAGIDTLAFEPADYAAPDNAAPGSRSVDEHIADALVAAGVDYVAMAGYMRMVGKPILEAFPNRVINLHPALLPSFPGAHGIADAFEHGVKVTGITVHFADAGMDSGPIISQKCVEVLEDDTLDTLEARIHDAEHELYPRVLQLIAEGRVHVEGRKARVD